MHRLRTTHDSIPNLRAGHRLCRLRPAPGAPAASAPFSIATSIATTTTSAAAATTATATLAKPTSATTSTITSVAPLDNIQLHQYVRACLRRHLSRWWPRLAVTHLYGDLHLRLGWLLRRWRTRWCLSEWLSVFVLQPRHRLQGLRLSNHMHGHVQLLRLGWQLRRWRARC